MKYSEERREAVLRKLGPIALAVGEAEQVRRERISLEHVGDEQGQSVNLLME